MLMGVDSHCKSLLRWNITMAHNVVNNRMWLWAAGLRVILDLAQANQYHNMNIGVDL